MRTAFAAVLLLVGLVAGGTAQEPVEAVLDGQVERGGEPLDTGTVVLHRVSPEAAGPIDSTRVGGTGDFSFRLPSMPGFDPQNEVYFASVRHDGVLYFGGAVTEAIQLDSLYRIEVYDTTAAPAGGARLPIVARNLLLEEEDDGWVVVDLFRIRNDGDRTVVSADDGVVWRHPLPPEATDFEPGESDLAPNAVRFEDGMIRVSSPIPPGERTYLMRYRVSELPFSVPVTDPTETLEILVREPAAPLAVSGVSRLQPVEIEPGSNYRRFAAENLESFVVEISEGEEDDAGSDVAWIAVILALVLAGVAIYALGRDRRPRKATIGETKEELLLRVAELDDAFAEADAPKKQRQRYKAERHRLLERIRELETSER